MGAYSVAARSAIAAVWPKSRTWKISDDQKAMKISPLAGKPAEASMLVNIPRLITAYYTEAPDSTVPAQRVAFGTSGHRGSSFNRPSNPSHLSAIILSFLFYWKRNTIYRRFLFGI